MTAVGEFIILIIMMVTVRGVSTYMTRNHPSDMVKYFVVVMGYALVVLTKTLLSGHTNAVVFNSMWNAVSLVMTIIIARYFTHQKIPNAEVVGLLTIFTGMMMTQF